MESLNSSARQPREESSRPGGWQGAGPVPLPSVGESSGHPTAHGHTLRYPTAKPGPPARRVRIRLPGALEDRWVDVRGVRTRYWAMGENGPPILLLHGLGGSVEVWLHNVRALAARHRVYAVDLVGFGLTDKPRVPYTLERFVSFVADFLDAMDVERAYLVGSSLGGAIAARFCSDRPDRVGRLVLVDSAGLGRGGSLFLHLACVPLLGELLISPTLPSLEAAMRRWVYDPALLTPAMRDFHHEMFQVPGAQRTFLSSLRSLATWKGLRKELHHHLQGTFASLGAPTLVVWGREDQVLPVRHAEHARKWIPECRVEIFERCGHLPQLEHATTFNQLLLEFFQPGL